MLVKSLVLDGHKSILRDIRDGVGRYESPVLRVLQLVDLVSLCVVHQRCSFYMFIDVLRVHIVCSRYDICSVRSNNDSAEQDKT